VSSDRALEDTRSYGRAAGLLTIALGSAGVLAYLFFAFASHSLSRDEYGEIVVLWSVVFVAASTLFRPIEQLLSRTLAEREQVGEDSGHVLRVAALIQVSLTALALLALMVLRGPIQDNLLEGGDVLFWVLVVSLFGFGGAYYARGFLAGRRRFALYASLLVLEGLARLGFALAVAVGIADGVDAVAIGIAVAPLAGLLVTPLAWRHRHSRPLVAPVKPVSADGAPSGRIEEPEFTLSRGGAFAAAVLVMMLSEQVIVGSGVLFVRASEGAAAAGFIFNVLMVARAPLMLFQAIAASLLPHLTRLRARGDESGKEGFRMSVNTTLITIAGFAALTTLGVLAIGPEVMQLAFGEKFEYDRAGLAIVAVGMGCYLSAAALNQAALAQGQARRAALCWVSCAVLFLAWNLASPMDAFRNVEVGFAGAAALLSGLLYAIYSRPHPIAADTFEPDSPREIEARLATADEVA
jgi:O-antigen/teichoic acid export membrane protein